MPVCTLLFFLSYPFYLYGDARFYAVSGRNVGDIAQLARASALQAEGQGFESPYLQEMKQLLLYKIKS